nr:MAG TPA: hypothetical protein [Caudoviricetes sp.]
MNSSGWPVNWPEMPSESDGTARNAERIVTLKSSGTSRGRQKAVHKQKRFPATSPLGTSSTRWRALLFFYPVFFLVGEKKHES